MHIPLNEFEQHIDDTILKRGLSYFKNSRVEEPDEITTGVYEFKVHGTETYTVILHVKNDVLTDHTCNCPYDLGAVCKHVAAALFYWQQEVLDIQPNPGKAGTSKPKKEPKKRKTVYEQVEEILLKLTPEEMRKFLHEYTGRDAQFRKAFLLNFRSETAGESKKSYTSHVKAILRAAKGKYNFIPWNRTADVWREVNILLGNAQRQLEKQNYKSAFFIATAVLEEMNEALQFADDSNGDIGSCIDLALGLMQVIIKSQIPEEIRKMIFDYCLTTYESDKFEGWDWHLAMLEMAVAVHKTRAEAKSLEKIMDFPQKTDYDTRRIQHIKLVLIQRTGTKKEVEGFINQNISNPEFRHAAISQAITEKDYPEAIRLANDGINTDKKSRPGLVNDWLNWLLQVALIQNQKDKVIEYARKLYLDHFNPQQDYYSILKDVVDKKQWKSFVEQLISEINQNSRWIDHEKIARIYITEQWWERLLELLQSDPTLHRLELYGDYLTAHYADEVVALYEHCIIDYLRENTGRNFYKNACRYLRRMKKMGAGKRVDEIIVQLKKEHPARYALFEELDKV